MTPPKLLEAFIEKCHLTGMLEYDKERNEYGLLQLREDASEEAKNAYADLMEWKKKGTK